MSAGHLLQGHLPLDCGLTGRGRAKLGQPSSRRRLNHWPRGCRSVTWNRPGGLLALRVLLVEDLPLELVAVGAKRVAVIEAIASDSEQRNIKLAHVVGGPPFASHLLAGTNRKLHRGRPVVGDLMDRHLDRLSERGQLGRGKRPAGLFSFSGWHRAI